MKVLVTTLAIITAFTFNAAAQASDLFKNKELPSIELPDLSGSKVNVADYGKNEKITIINFWATWCAPCMKELNNIADLYEDWQDDYNLELIAVSIDDSRATAKVKTTVNGRGWDYTVLLDANQELKRAFNFQSPPYTVLVDAKGNIVDIHNGYHEGDEYELEEKIKALGMDK